MTNPRWLVLADPTGKVIAVSGGAPEAWCGRSADTLLADAPSIASALREVTDLVLSGNPAACRLVSGGAPSETVDVEVVALSVIAIERAEADLEELVRRAVLPFLSQAADRDVQLDIESECARVTVLCDAAKIVWVIATLVGNALRFARAGTRRLPGGSVRVLLREDSTSALIEVKDDGPGIEPSRLRNLFEAGDGQNPSGVALRMARDVALAHGGSLEVDSSIEVDEHFTRVRLVLPKSKTSR